MSYGCAKQLRNLLQQNKFLVMPGIYDCLSARIAEEAGFPAIFLSGGALAYSFLGKPDFGFLSLSDFGSAIQRITSCCGLPLLADADNGFGNAIQAGNTGAVYEHLGAAGLQIDDKILPATRPDQNQIIDWNLMAPKIQAIRDNVSPEFVILYRTCANLYGLGLEEAIRRINLVKDCGADFAYVDGLGSIEEVAEVSKQADIPLLINMNERGFVGANMTVEQIRKYHYSIGLFPISSILAAAQGMIDVLDILAEQGSTASVRNRMTDPPSRIHEMMGQTKLVEQYAPYYIS